MIKFLTYVHVYQNNPRNLVLIILMLVLKKTFFLLCSKCCDGGYMGGRQIQDCSPLLSARTSYWNEFPNTRLVQRITRITTGFPLA